MARAADARLLGPWSPIRPPRWQRPTHADAALFPGSQGWV